MGNTHMKDLKTLIWTNVSKCQDENRLRKLLSGGMGHGPHEVRSVLMARDNNGTPLTVVACQVGNYAGLRVLLEFDAPVLGADVKGRTVFHYIAKTRFHEDIWAELLVAVITAGANPFAMDMKGVDAFRAFEKRNAKRFLRILEEQVCDFAGTAQVGHFRDNGFFKCSPWWETKYISVCKSAFDSDGKVFVTCPQCKKSIGWMRQFERTSCSGCFNYFQAPASDGKLLQDTVLRIYSNENQISSKMDVSLRHSKLTVSTVKEFTTVEIELLPNYRPQNLTRYLQGLKPSEYEKTTKALEKAENKMIRKSAKPITMRVSVRTGPEADILLEALRSTSEEHPRVPAPVPRVPAEVNEFRHRQSPCPNPRRPSTAPRPEQDETSLPPVRQVQSAGVIQIPVAYFAENQEGCGNIEIATAVAVPPPPPPRRNISCNV